jgi:hypothetical protein
MAPLRLPGAPAGTRMAPAPLAKRLLGGKDAAKLVRASFACEGAQGDMPRMRAASQTGPHATSFSRHPITDGTDVAHAARRRAPALFYIHGNHRRKPRRTLQSARSLQLCDLLAPEGWKVPCGTVLARRLGIAHHYYGTLTTW